MNLVEADYSLRDASAECNLILLGQSEKPRRVALRCLIKSMRKCRNLLKREQGKVVAEDYIRHFDFEGELVKCGISVTSYSQGDSFSVNSASFVEPCCDEFEYVVLDSHNEECSRLADMITEDDHRQIVDLILEERDRNEG